MGKLSKSQITSLLWAARTFADRRVPPYVFRSYKSIDALRKLGLIEPWFGFGCPMYRFTAKGLEEINDNQ